MTEEERRHMRMLYELVITLEQHHRKLSRHYALILDATGKLRPKALSPAAYLALRVRLHRLIMPIPPDTTDPLAAATSLLENYRSQLLNYQHRLDEEAKAQVPLPAPEIMKPK